MIQFGNLSAYILDLIQDFMGDDGISNLERSRYMTTHATPKGDFYLSISMKDMRKDVKSIALATWTSTWLLRVYHELIDDDVQVWRDLIIEEEPEVQIPARSGLTSNSMFRMYIEAKRVSMEVQKNL